MKKLIDYFSQGVTSRTLQTIGAEIETQFIDKNGQAIKAQTSQQMLRWLIKNNWQISSYKGDVITSLIDKNGNRISYELGRHNLEIATIATAPQNILSLMQSCLNQLYAAARYAAVMPYFKPILHDNRDLLIIPDQRDAIWLKLDGRHALAPLARTSSVQFTFSVSPLEAIKILNKLGEKINLFLADFPQDIIWKKYIVNSAAKYLPDRYGGPLLFSSLIDYCQSLIRHNVVQGPRLIPYKKINDLDIPLYLRSIWWYFRLKRYNNALCIEVRPMARHTDDQFKCQLEKICQIISN